jgi:hypothetical protein
MKQHKSCRTLEGFIGADMRRLEPPDPQAHNIMVALQSTNRIILNPPSALRRQAV